MLEMCMESCLALVLKILKYWTIRYELNLNERKITLKAQIPVSILIFIQPNFRSNSAEQTNH